MSKEEQDYKKYLEENKKKWDDAYAELAKDRQRRRKRTAENAENKNVNREV